MAGQLTIDTLKASSGVLATQNGMTGIAKAWVEFNGVGGTAIPGSYNVSSVTRTGTGYYTITFTTNMVDANYSIVGSTSPAFGVAPIFLLTNLNGSGELASTTSSFGICTQSTVGVQDSKYANVAVFGN